MPRRPKPDPVRLEVFHHLFAALTEEMGVTLLRSSFSPNIKERRDFSCALFDHQGRTVGQAAHLPVHLGSAPMSVAAAIEAIDMRPGDAVVLNDPFAGGTHLPDITVVSPVFLSKRRRPDFFCANRAHHADVGGAHPGSMGPTSDIHGEGLRIPPTRLVREGEVDREVLGLLLANMRVPREREGDLLAQLSANRLGARRLVQMATEYGAAEVRARATQLMDWTERLTRATLAALPDGEWSFEDELEVPLEPLEPLVPLENRGNARIRLRLTKRGSKLVCDFRDTDRLPSSPVNTVRAVTVSAVFYVLRTLLPPGTPTNDGVLRPVKILTRPGTLCDAAYPTGVAAGNVETSQRLVDVILGALAQALPEHVPAASAGTMSNLTFGGVRADGETCAYYETIAGGAGGGPHGPGETAVHTHMTNTRNTPIEALEASYPVRVLSYRVRRGSGGAGRHPGGDGIEKRLLFLAPVHLSWVAERQKRGPWGLRGGGSGAPGGARVLRPGDATPERLPARASIELVAQSQLEVATPGGGGYGPVPP
ncbi:MAG: hydantoinase B/oxoprolinase family protein [Planctomycetota bacterium]|nr:hydantoinase B/oxoprolinase family protein [Planctomycetota bacterium]